MFCIFTLVYCIYYLGFVPIVLSVIASRKNSAIHLGKVYEQVQRHLQAEAAGGLGLGGGDGAPQGGSDPASRGFSGGGARSTKLSPLRRQSSQFQVHYALYVQLVHNL